MLHPGPAGTLNFSMSSATVVSASNRSGRQKQLTPSGVEFCLSHRHVFLNLVLRCCSFTEVRKEACFILGLLAVKPEYQHQIATAQALPGLVKLLQVRLVVH
jgi:hypothetical protein